MQACRKAPENKEGEKKKNPDIVDLRNETWSVPRRESTRRARLALKRVEGLGQKRSGVLPPTEKKLTRVLRAKKKKNDFTGIDRGETITETDGIGTDSTFALRVCGKEVQKDGE